MDSSRAEISVGQFWPVLLGLSLLLAGVGLFRLRAVSSDDHFYRQNTPEDRERMANASSIVVQDMAVALGVVIVAGGTAAVATYMIARRGMQRYRVRRAQRQRGFEVIR